MENYHGASGSTIKGTGGKRGRASDKKLRDATAEFERDRKDSVERGHALLLENESFRRENQELLDRVNAATKRLDAQDADIETLRGQLALAQSALSKGKTRKGRKETKA